MLITRRSVLRATMGGIAIAGLGRFSEGIAQTVPTPSRPAATGFFRFNVGRLEVTAISDGYVPVTPDEMTQNIGNASAFAVASGNASLLVPSDTTNHPQMMLRNPDAASAFDMDGGLVR